MSLLFDDCEDLDEATLHLLTKAYEAAIVELSADYHLSSSELSGLIVEMADAIRDLYHAGELRRTKLTRHAVDRSLLSIGHRNAPGGGPTHLKSRNAAHVLPPHYNGAPGELHWVIRQHPMTEKRTLDSLQWGLIPYSCKDADGGRRPINAKAETVAQLPTFSDAYRRRRCLVPIDYFFEWKAAKPEEAEMPKQPYAIGMKSEEPFALAGIWENWQPPDSEQWLRTFAILTTNSNELLRVIHSRMPLIIAPEDYDSWLSAFEPDPRHLLVPYPAQPMTMRPI